MGQSAELALLMAGVFNILHLVAVAVCFVVIDHAGRRPLAIWGAFTAGVAWAAMASLIGVYNDRWVDAASWSATAMAFLFVIAFGMSYSPLGWALPPEVYTNASRAKGVALSCATNWFCNFIVGVATPPMIDGIGFGTYALFSGFCFVGVVWAYYLVPETKGKTLEEMDCFFGDNASAEESAVIQGQIAAHTIGISSGHVV